MKCSPTRLEHARTLIDLGASLRASGRRDDAQEQLRRGLDLATRCGATVLRGRSHDELRATGARLRRLAVSGLSNVEIAQALFVTRSTIEKHLSHAYDKLHIRSRDRLAQMLVDPAVFES